MCRETRTIQRDPELKIEICTFREVVHRFPLHFHDHYVIGCIVSGRRKLFCSGKTFEVEPGDLLLFNLRHPHSCEELDGWPLDYRSIHVSGETMRATVGAITGTPELPVFRGPLHPHSELVPLLEELHEMILRNDHPFRREEAYLLLVETLLRDCSPTVPLPPAAVPESQLAAVSRFLETGYARNITLDELAHRTGIGKYRLLRAFTRSRGISPCRYLESIRISCAVKLLAQGCPSAEAAVLAGFADQSHFTRVFKRTIGVTPGQYRHIFTPEARP